MPLSEYKELLATTATVCSILQFMSGMLVCQKFINKGSAENESGFPFVAGFLSCSLWLRYSYLIEDTAMMLVNFVGCALMLCYTITFYVYTTRKKLVMKQMLIVMIVITLAHTYSRYETDRELALTRFGILTCCTTLIFFGSPLANLAHVLKVKSSESLPFPIILMTFIVSAQWYLYGIIINNYFVQYPNLIGCLLASFQLLLFAIFPSRGETIIAEKYTVKKSKGESLIL